MAMRRALALLAGIAIVGTAVHAATTDLAGQHAAAGVAAGSRDFPGLATLCSSPPANPVELKQILARPWAMPPAFAPAKVFDNLYFVGHRGVSAWVLKTSAGLVLIDTLNNGEEARAFIEEGMIKLGLDPATVKTVILTHGHGDHTGGAAWFVGRYHPKVVMSAADWAMMNDPATRIDAPGWSDAPKPDVLVGKRMVLTSGSTRIELLLTPGHTPGTLSLIFPVTDNGRRHTAVLWGGTGFNFGPELARYKAYASSAEAMRRQVLARGIDVFLSNHPARDQADVKIAALQKRVPGGAHPFVLAAPRNAAAFTTFRECALAQVARIENTPAR